MPENRLQWEHSGPIISLDNVLKGINDHLLPFKLLLYALKDIDENCTLK